MSETAMTTETPKLELEMAMLELPRAFRLKTEDLGIPESDYAMIAADYSAGGTTYTKQAETLLQVFLEMMSKTPNGSPRVLQTPFGAPRVDATGRPITKICSRWAVDTDDCNAANVSRSNPAPEPAEWKNFVIKNWHQIMPRLVFTSDSGDPGLNASGNNFNLELWQRAHAKNTADTSLARVNLKKWLTPFLKNPVSTWDGRK